jgi:hypothetical protein
MLKGPILKKIKLYIIELFFEKHHKIFSIEKISVFEKKNKSRPSREIKWWKTKEVPRREVPIWWDEYQND